MASAIAQGSRVQAILGRANVNSKQACDLTILRRGIEEAIYAEYYTRSRQDEAPLLARLSKVGALQFMVDGRKDGFCNLCGYLRMRPNSLPTFSFYPTRLDTRLYGAVVVVRRLYRLCSIWQMMLVN